MAPSQSAPITLSLSLLLLSLSAAAASSYTNLVFKGCADQKIPDSNPLFKQTLKTLTATLTAQSSSTNFHKTASSSSAAAAYAINALYQCRGDLAHDDCSACVNAAVSMADKLCGAAVAVRVQLGGCYIRYELAGFRKTSQTELVYKICGSTRPSGPEFADKLDTALGEIAKGVAGRSSSFYAGGYGSVYVMGQCEGDLSGGECVNCVKMAAEKAKSECGSAISAQIYLYGCYVSYTYYPNGAPANRRELPTTSGRAKNTQKTVAIAMGGLVGMGLITACLLFTKSAFKKKPHAYKYGG